MTRFLAAAALLLVWSMAGVFAESPGAGAPATTAAPVPDDPYLWLEDVTGDKALEWVRARNADSVKRLTETDEFRQLSRRLLDILDSDARIPFVAKKGSHYYNFWQDAKHERGVWRRTTLEEYRKESPAWETVLDLDALGAAEKEPWVWGGSQCLPPAHRRCLIEMSRGGADATVTREFDVVDKAFVKDGFYLPEAKGGASWIDQDTVYVQTDFGPGTLTTSGYPRIVKRWKRGTPLEKAEVVYEGRAEDSWVIAYHDHMPGFERDVMGRNMTFYTNEMFLVRDGRRVKLDKPDDADATLWRDLVLITPRTDWTAGGATYPGGSLLAADLEGHLKGARRFEVLFDPGPRRSLVGFQTTENHVMLEVLDNVRSRVEVLTRRDGRWQRETLPGAPELGTLNVYAVDPHDSDDYFLTVTDFVTPTSLFMGTVGKGAAQSLKQQPAFWDATGVTATQHEAVSKDGTRVPYFQVARAGLKLDGTNPTLLYGYGGFERPQLPGYNPNVGAGWLERGGVYVLANIRGGGEFGPRWHQAALKANRPRAYEDFIAIAEDLIARKVTSPRHLGIRGGSNGGLLMGNMLAMRPDLFGAIVCQVPLLDMRRYHTLLAGASWMSEYGNPDDPAEWAFIRTFSPYHMVRKDVTYPPTLFTTSTRDDRVHPGHARKMVAKMLGWGKDVLYYENVEGGHGGSANNKQAAFMSAMSYVFLQDRLR